MITYKGQIDLTILQAEKSRVKVHHMARDVSYAIQSRKARPSGKEHCQQSLVWGLSSAYYRNKKPGIGCRQKFNLQNEQVNKGKTLPKGGARRGSAP